MVNKNVRIIFIHILFTILFTILYTFIYLILLYIYINVYKVYKKLYIEVKSNNSPIKTTYKKGAKYIFIKV